MVYINGKPTDLAIQVRDAMQSLQQRIDQFGIRSRFEVFNHDNRIRVHITIYDKHDQSFYATVVMPNSLANPANRNQRSKIIQKHLTLPIISGLASIFNSEDE